MAATMKDLAKETGLGLATISSYFNGGNVRPKNREKIEKAIGKLHFELNETARGLKTNRSMMVGAVIPELTSAYCAQVLSVIEDKLRSHGYGMLVCDCRSDREREKEAVEFLMRRRVDGIFSIPVDIKGSHLKRFVGTGKPAVVIDREIDDPGFDSVCVDNRLAIETGMRRLYENGHRRIGLIVGEQTNNASKQRKKGYLLACEQLGLTVDENLIYIGSETVECGAEGMKTLLERCPDMTAVIAGSHVITVGMLIELNAQNISVPDRISVIGFDDPQFAQAVHPRMSILNQPVQEIGEKAADIMLARLKASRNKDKNEPEEQEKLPYQHLWLKASFISGNSVRKIDE